MQSTKYQFEMQIQKENINADFPTFLPNHKVCRLIFILC